MQRSSNLPTVRENELADPSSVDLPALAVGAVAQFNNQVAAKGAVTVLSQSKAKSELQDTKNPSNIPSTAVVNTQFSDSKSVLSSEEHDKSKQNSPWNQKTGSTRKRLDSSALESDSDHESSQGGEKKKDKKLVFLSRSVLQSVRESPMTTGTEIAYEILELYKRFSDKVDFKNVQRRVYDALNVLSAMDIIQKQKNHILYNPDNEFIDDSVEPSTKPRKGKLKSRIKVEGQAHVPGGKGSHENEERQRLLKQQIQQKKSEVEELKKRVQKQ